MSINYTWNITQFDVQNVDGLNNVAVQACFVCKGEENGLQGMEGSDVKLLPPDAQSFTALENVTEAQAVEWVKAALGDRVSFFEGSVADQIARQQDANKVTSHTPAWAATAN